MKQTTYKQFLLLWSTQSISNFGSSLTSYALILWVYQQQGSVSSIAILSICTYLPSILFSFLAGTLADHMNKKNIMLYADVIAAIGTFTIMILFITNNLSIWHIYVVNFLISFMDAFQTPASYVATSLLVPKKYYSQASSLQSFSNSISTILTPTFAIAILSFTNLYVIFVIDLITFAIAFSSLLLFINIPSIEKQTQHDESFTKQCLMGLNYLKQHTSLLYLVLFFSLINLLASMSDRSLLPALVLAKTNNDEQILGYVTSSIGIGALVGSVLSSFSKNHRNKTTIIFISCAISFLFTGIPLAIFDKPYIWIISVFLSNLPLPFLNANLSSLMRLSVPIEMQGRVFSARDTIQYITIPIGLALGGYLGDYVFEPIMSSRNPISSFFSLFIGSGKGGGIAVIFLLTSIIGTTISLLALSSKHIKELHKQTLER